MLRCLTAFYYSGSSEFVADSEASIYVINASELTCKKDPRISLALKNGTLFYFISHVR